MRHIYGNLAVYLIATFLVGASLLWAWMRNAQLVVSTEAEVIAARYIGLDEDFFEWRELGEYVYIANCRNCHTNEGEGRGAYPPVTGQGRWLALPDGREYLIALHLYGLTSDRSTTPMPPFGNLSNPEVAAVINFMLTEFAGEARVPESDELVTPADVEELRGRGWTPWDVNDVRP